jgi:hypothetical protein
MVKKDEPAELIELFVKAAGWEYVGMVDRDPERGLNYEVRWNVDATTSVHYLIDDLGPDESGELVCLFVHGSDESAVEPVLQLIEQGVRVWSMDELIEIAQLSFGTGLPDQQARAMLRLGLGAPRQPRADVIDVFRRACQEDEPIVRYSALYGIVHTEWPECVDIVASLTDDPVPAVAQLAAQIRDLFQGAP